MVFSKDSPDLKILSSGLGYSIPDDGRENLKKLYRR
jgi:hypothetical protein